MSKPWFSSFLVWFSDLGFCFAMFFSVNKNANKGVCPLLIGVVWMIF